MVDKTKTQEEINQEILANDAEKGYVDSKPEDEQEPRQVPEIDYSFTVECDPDIAGRVMGFLEAEGFDTLTTRYSKGHLRFTEGDESQVKLLVDEYTTSRDVDNLNDLKNDWKLKVMGFADDLYDKLLVGYSKAEVASFPAKGPAARAVIENRATSDQTDLLLPEASRLGITIEELAGKIDPRATLFTKVSSEIAAFRSMSEAQIDLVDNPNAFEALIEQLLTNARDAMVEYGL